MAISNKEIGFSRGAGLAFERAGFVTDHKLMPLSKTGVLGRSNQYLYPPHGDKEILYRFPGRVKQSSWMNVTDLNGVMLLILVGKFQMKEITAALDHRRGRRLQFGCERPIYRKYSLDACGLFHGRSPGSQRFFCGCNPRPTS